MPGDTVITLGFAGLVIAVFSAGVGVVMWLRGQLSAERRATMADVKQTLEPIAAEVENMARDQADELKALRAALHEIAGKLHGHELYSERQFMSKQTGTLIVEGIRADLKEFRGEMVARLMRIEGQTKPA